MTILLLLFLIVKKCADKCVEMGLMVISLSLEGKKSSLSMDSFVFLIPRYIPSTQAKEEEVVFNCV
ncbi:hypothetical protein CLAVI_000007 [Candidatus Clavichlamydia salmonicola]|uniref:hypothetical protein n=1 Tax=Candidatus Clavichlamydia salmonicola TaxID=469812 RepID=UPI001890E02B|nr:hypothetical protein [Candidatus Clavichlamydia salmonicola]MBF5050406.1 hypothetical protein [Candidatus Clavichlamydia salmonicola]